MKKSKKKTMIFRGYSVKMLEKICARVKKIVEKKNKQIFICTENEYYFSDELVNLLFHLTRVFVVFREEEKFFPRKTQNGMTFKSFALDSGFQKKDLKEVKQGVLYIVTATKTILHGIC